VVQRLKRSTRRQPRPPAQPAPEALRLAFRQRLPALRRDRTRVCSRAFIVISKAVAMAGDLVAKSESRRHRDGSFVWAKGHCGHEGSPVSGTAMSSRFGAGGRPRRRLAGGAPDGSRTKTILPSHLFSSSPASTRRSTVRTLILRRPAYSRGRYQVPGNGSSPISWASSLLRRRSTSRRQMASLLGDDGGWERAMPKKNPARETGRAEVICLPFSPFEELAGGLPLAAQAAGLGHGYSDLATSAAPRSSRIRSRHTFFVDKPRALAARINIAL